MLNLRLLSSFLLAGLALLCATPGGAAGLVLDPSFGTGGRVTGSLPRNAVLTGFAAVRSPDGRIYVDQGPALHALLPNGARDPGFGDGGSVTFPIVGWPTYLTVAGVAVDGQGRVLVAATTNENELDPGEPAAVATVIRYLPDGRLDPGFADGGVLRTTFGFPLPRNETGGSPAPADNVAVRLSGLGVDRSGRILLAGSYTARIADCPTGPYEEIPRAFFARLDPAGRLDGSFGQGGLAVQLGLGSITDLRLESSGATTFTATSPVCALPRSGVLARLDASGSPDAFFGPRGRRPLPERPARLAATRDGRLLVLSVVSRGEGGKSHTLTVIRRFRGNGRPDRSFGHRGKAASRLRGRSSGFGALAVDPRGRVLLGGDVFRSGTSHRRFVLRRLRADGSADRSFGFRGTLSTGFGARARVSAREILLQPRGRILLAGSLGAPYLVNEQGFALARYRP